jgi:hypothetical protein
MNSFLNTFCISVGVLILAMYVVVRMLGSLVTAFVDFGFGVILQLLTVMEQDSNGFDLGTHSATDASTTPSHSMPI